MALNKINVKSEIALQRELKKSLQKLQLQIFNIIEYWLIPMFKEDMISFDSTEKDILIQALQSIGVEVTSTMDIQMLKKLYKNYELRQKDIVSSFSIGDIIESNRQIYLGNLEIISIKNNNLVVIDDMGREHIINKSDANIVKKPRLKYSQDDDFNTRYTKVKKNINSLVDNTSKNIISKHIYNIFKNVDSKFRNDIGINVHKIGFSKEIKEKITFMIETNINLIKSIPQDIIQSLDNVLYQGSFGGNRQQISKALQSIKNVSKNKIDTISRDQTNKALNAVSVIRATQVGLEYYEWLTAKDERVSEDNKKTGMGGHKKLHGKIFRYDTPEAIIDYKGTKGHPSQRVNCRCTAVPIYVYPNQKVVKSQLGYKIINL